VTRIGPLAVVAAVVGVLAIPGAAPAATVSTATYQGAITPSGSVAFDAKVRNGKVKRILGSPGPPATGITFTDLPMTCDQGAIPLETTIVSTLWVGDGRVRIRAETIDPSLHGKLRAHGVFTDDYSSVSGTVRALGDWGDSATATNCDSGRLPWSATVQPAPDPGGDRAASSSTLRAR
jgi:hypothetical protein